jgi:hypothetical protein
MASVIVIQVTQETCAIEKFEYNDENNCFYF